MEGVGCWAAHPVRLLARTHDGATPRTTPARASSVVQAGGMMGCVDNGLLPHVGAPQLQPYVGAPQLQPAPQHA